MAFAVGKKHWKCLAARVSIYWPFLCMLIPKFLLNASEPGIQLGLFAIMNMQLPYMLFTGLEDYKARGTQASQYFTASFYKEFAESKDLVLIRGDIVFTSKLTDEKAKWLLEITQSFYLNDVRYKLVECFNKEPSDFEFNKNSITN
ncbi:hypothetical protein Gotri_026747 [Gossypium trilobum]|uniref:Uncharacterized protein n=1 Tax=Gossypium trilobum TaxID=34281 RepID=A0A7J9FTC4_9ROSI|nr:hypothetical protein [Gossypium trilobum]